MVFCKYYCGEKCSFKKREAVAQELLRNQSHTAPAAGRGAPTPSDASLSPLLLQTQRYRTDFSLHQLAVEARLLTHSARKERRLRSMKFSKFPSRWCCSKLLFYSTLALGGTKGAVCT